MSPQGYDSFVAILSYRDGFEASLIQRCSDAGETSAAVVDFIEQPARLPMTAIASKDKHGLSVFIFLLDPTS